MPVHVVVVRIAHPGPHGRYNVWVYRNIPGIRDFHEPVESAFYASQSEPSASPSRSAVSIDERAHTLPRAECELGSIHDNVDAFGGYAIIQRGAQRVIRHSVELTDHSDNCGVTKRLHRYGE